MVERRAYTPFEVRSMDDALGTFSGTASRYNVIDAYGTAMVPGCFDRSLAERGAHFPLIWQHKSDEPIGSFNAHTSKTGLEIDGAFNLEVEDGRKAYALLRKGDIRGLSLGFTIRESEPGAIDGVQCKLLTDVDVWEASVVTFPACPGAEVTDVRSMERMTRGLDDLDDNAKKVVADIFEDTAKRIREAIGKTEEPKEEPKDEPPKEEPSEDKTEETPEDEPKEKDGCGKDCKRAIALETIRECRAILERSLNDRRI